MKWTSNAALAAVICGPMLLAQNPSAAAYNRRGAEQFKLHQTVNGNDVENAAWRYLSMARAGNVEEARASILPIEHDSRVPMMQIYALYKGKAGVDDVLAAAKEGNPPPGVLRERLFYAHLYIGLYYEAAGKAKLARDHIALAVQK